MSEPAQPFKVTLMEQTAPVWGRLKEHYEERLRQARIRNDDSRLTEIETAALRARIAEAKYFLSLDQDLPEPE